MGESTSGSRIPVSVGILRQSVRRRQPKVSNLSGAKQSMGSADMTVTRDIRLPDDSVKNGNTWITFAIRRREGDDSYDLGTNTVKVRVIDDETP